MLPAFLNIKTMRKKLILQTFLVIIYSLFSLQLIAQKSRPNILFILVDDLGYADVGFNGSKYFETPAIDALSAQSLIFDNSYMYPSCSPSRTALFTGKQSFRTGVYAVPVGEYGTNEENIFSRWTVQRKHSIYSEPLADAGYKSIHIGKYHIVGPYPQKELSLPYPFTQKLSQPEGGDYSWVENHQSKEVKQYYPEQRGFLKNVGGTYSGDPAFAEGNYKCKGGGYISPFGNPFIEPKPDDHWLTDRLTNEAISFMEQHKKEPFFINLHYYSVHRPIVPRSKELFDKYMKKPGDPTTGQGLGCNRETMAGYATMIESLDNNINRLIEYLDNNNLRDNTIIIFSSDNGYNKKVSANKLMRASKGHIYEGGVRVPTFINWPKKIKPRRTLLPISCIDYFPTFMELAGIDYNGILDGNSIVPLFKKDKSNFEKRPIFWHLASQWRHATCSAIRKGKYKLIQYLANGKIELYNLELDPVEANNLEKSNPKIAKQLKTELEHWRKQNNVPLPPNSCLEY